MLQRLATRAIFWCALTFLSVTGGLAFLDAIARNTDPTTASGALRPVLAGMPALLDAAPFMSLAVLMAAITGWWLLHDDVTPRDATEHALHDQMRRLANAIDASVDGFVFLRTIRADSGDVEDFEITDVNPTATRLIRQSRELLVGRRLRRDLPAGYSDRLLQQYIDAVTFSAPITEDVRVDPRRFAASWLSHHAVPTTEGVAVTIRDVSTLKREETRLRRASLTDHLTQLYNRRGFLTLAEQHLRIARRQDKDSVLLYLDLDDFKQLNDRYGHAEGDRALTAVARLLRRAVRDCDIVGRMGGDEFTIMALDADGAGARLIQRRIEERVALLNASGELVAQIALTIGHTRVRPSDHAALTELLSRADHLLYARKRRRKLSVAATQRSSGARSGRTDPSRDNSGIAANALSSGALVPPDLAAIAHAAAAAGVPSMTSAPSFSPTHTA